MSGEESRITAALAAPDVVVQSDYDPDVRLYHRLYEHAELGEKHLCVVVKSVEDDHYLLTAFFTDRVKRGAVIWTKK